MRTKIKMSNNEEFILEVEVKQFLSEVQDDFGKIYPSMLEVEEGKYINTTQIVKVEKY